MRVIEFKPFFRSLKMSKKVFLLSVLVIAAFVTSAVAADVIGPRIENQKLLTGDETLPNVSGVPSNPSLITDSPGTVVGTTEYDYQSNGSSGNRMALDSQGGKHFAWMNGSGGSFPPTQRSVYFNYVDNAGNWLVPEIGQNISLVNGDGYNQLTLTQDDKAAVAYHSSSSNFVIYAVDNFPGMGIFSYFDPPDMLSLRCYWPYLTVDRGGRIHIVSCENAPNAGDPQALGYTRSTDGGATWSSFTRVDTLETISQNVVSSPVSDKVAIVYANPIDYETQWRNDITYIESLDGLSWNFRTKNNVTEYGTGGDSLYAYTDLAALYDYNDNLNIIWNAQWVTDEGIYYKTFLFHYSTGSDAITEITHSDSTWISGCDYGAWNRPISKMSLGANEVALYAVYTAFDTSDCSAGGYANGDIHMAYSVDGGGSWSQPVNMTNSPSPGCAPGDCDSDHWSSVADRVDGNLHVFYVNDKDAGGIPQTEGTVTVNPVMYMEYPNPVTSIDDNPSVPSTFRLAQNYPNPFNAKTNINFKLENESDVELSVYDITGAKVQTLVNGRMDAGEHSVNWDASDVASGVYYYKLNANGEQSTRKMTLLK